MDYLDLIGDGFIINPIIAILIVIIVFVVAIFLNYKFAKDDLDDIGISFLAMCFAIAAILIIGTQQLIKLQYKVDYTTSEAEYKVQLPRTFEELLKADQIIAGTKMIDVIRAKDLDIIDVPGDELSVKIITVKYNAPEAFYVYSGTVKDINNTVKYVIKEIRH